MENKIWKFVENHKRRVLGAAVSVAAATALALAGLFGSPEEIVQTAPPPAIVEVVQAADAADSLPEEEKQTKRTRFSRLSAWFSACGDAVRLLVLLPLWLVGKALLFLLSAAATGLGRFLLPLLINLLLLLGMALLLYRLLNPDKPLRSFFSKRNVILLLCAWLALSAADVLLPRVFAQYTLVKWLTIGLVGLAVPVGLYYTLRGKGLGWLLRRKRAPKERTA